MTNLLFTFPGIRRIVTIALAGGLTFTAMACGSDHVTGLTPEENANAYWDLTLNHRVANLATVAPHNTIQLTATPRTLDGTPYQTTLQPTYSSSNQAVLRVDSTGLVTALQSGIAMVVATLKIDKLTHEDTITIGVSEGSAPQVSRIAVELSPTWTQPIARPVGVPYTITAYDAAGDTVKVPNSVGGTEPLNLVTDYTVSDPGVGQYLGIRSGLQYVMAQGPGKTTLTFHSYVFGTPMSDSIDLTVSQPLFAQITLSHTPITAGTGIAFSPTTTTIAAGGVILFMNGLSEPVDIVFDDSSVVKESNPNIGYYYFYGPDGSGDILNLPVKPRFGWDPKGGRSIYEPGTYRYHNPKTGATGIVIVKAQ